MFDFALKCLEKIGAVVIITLIDMTKAFDLVDHSTLAQILIKYNVDPTDIMWMINFLKNRKQVVKHNNLISDAQAITCCKPAGTKLAPLLFTGWSISSVPLIF